MLSDQHPCDKIQDLLDAYRDGEVNSLERTSVERHLASCNDCQSKLADIEHVVGLLKGLPKKEMPCDLSQSIDSLIQRRSKKSKSNLRVWQVLSTAASIIALFIVWQVVTYRHSNMVVINAGAGTKNETRPSGSPKVEQNLLASKSGLPKKVVVLNLPPGELKTKAISIDKKNYQESLPASVADQGALRTQSKTNVDFQDGSIAIAEISGEEQETIAEALGIATDEDGLYAIKM